MNTTWNRARLRSAILALSVAAACSSPTAPTPPPPPAAPAIVCPASESAASPFGVAVNVSFDSPTVSGGQAPLTTTCTPQSGAAFSVGANTVSCQVVDNLKRSASCSFTVTITPPSQIQLTKFVAFGDSITAGENGANPLTLNPFAPLQSVILFGQEYPTDLQLALRTRYQLQAPGITVTNDGNPGEFAGAPATLTRFSRDVPGRGFQAVLIMEGSNDVNEAARSGPSLTGAAIANLQTMIRSAKSLGLKPYLASLPPMNASSACIPACRGTGAALVSSFNVQLSSLAFSEAIPFVDVNAAFGGDLTLLSTDGLHPNALGYQRIADTFFQSLQSTLDSTPQSLRGPVSPTLRAPVSPTLTRLR